MGVEKHMPPNQFNNVVRMVFQADRSRVMSLRNATFNTLRRLGVCRDPSKAVARLPAGSDQCDLMSIFVWMNKVDPSDVLAVQQIIAIDATAVSRTGK